jgi:hypothetical protein
VERRSWAGVIWREAGHYGPEGGFVARQHLGRHTLAVMPQVGMKIRLNGHDYYVTKLFWQYCYVRPA